MTSMRTLAVLSGLLLLPVACSTPHRNPVPREQLSDVHPVGVASWRFTGDEDSGLQGDALTARMEAMRTQLQESGLAETPAQVLAISGGGDNGAYGAGLLKGWSESGSRPEFLVVTGISTGALTAPFAFLGPEYDDRLEYCYTTLSTDDLVQDKGLLEGLSGDSLGDPAGLRAMLAQQLDEETYRRIGEEHRRGRRLFIGTTNLDRMEPTIWNVSGIAADDVPGGRELVCDIIVASASIPGYFPPVMIDVVGTDGEIYDEMHVDGGVSTQVFTYPVSLRMRDVTLAEPTSPGDPIVWVIRNAPLVFRFEPTDRAVMPIAGRAISGLIRSNGIGDLYRIWLTALRDGFDFRLASIPFDFDAEPQEAFDPIYMKKLFERGRADALDGTAWNDYPPQFGPEDEALLRLEFESRNGE